ncbi:hypothetical protein G3KMM_00322 [Candidatus Nanosyncoccus nanoralicus]|uniref:Uncharacterized protein n=1 Tax=Candidatus Nanosyncoccus nanoralicus TaxID=2171996 RepID=A0ABY0FMC7_9BACT|nr:hypothetical protein G3KMM_00322 [Candidatus Nanosyncoccus nanoralicus]
MAMDGLNGENHIFARNTPKSKNHVFARDAPKIEGKDFG